MLGYTINMLCRPKWMHAVS